MQRWFYTVQPNAPALLAERAARQAILETPLPEVAAEQVSRALADWTELLDGFIEAGLCEKTGVAVMQAEWCYEGRSVPQSRVIMLGMQHDYARLSQAPEVEAGAEVIRPYGRAAHAAKQVAGWLRQESWAAEPVTGPMTGDFTLIPPALACGFGDLGKHGSIIDRDLGANFRLSAVLTDAPFAPTSTREHGIDAFCASCRICEDACPPEAIYPEKQQVRGAQVVRGFRLVPIVLQRASRLWDLHRGLFVVSTRNGTKLGDQVGTMRSRTKGNGTCPMMS